MPFGMKNAPATFQRLINTVTAGLHKCSAYLDDIVIQNTTWDDHLKTLGELFDRLAAACLTLNLGVCTGHCILSRQGSGTCGNVIQ